MFALKPFSKRNMGVLPRAETPFGLMPEGFETLFNRLFTRWPMMEMADWPYAWGVTTEEKEKEIVVRFELPGFDPAEVKLELIGDRLMVEAEHKEAVEKGKEETERAYAHVKRDVTLPPAIEVEKAVALYKNGVLEVRIPRKAEAIARRIEVKT